MKLANLQDYKLTNIQQYVELFLYTTVCFIVPLFIGHPQLLVGIAVNALLISSALNLKGWKLLPVILAPALGALSRGLLFGPLTIYLLYLIPFIWIGNTILILTFKHFKLKQHKNYLFTLAVGSLAKSGFLFLAAFILFKLGIIPIVFLTAMGLLQLTTAVGGGIVAYGFQALKRRVIQ